jgi:glucan endo-1,3-alpha-glucosidase
MDADLFIKGCCGAWDINKVVRWINTYKGFSAQYKVNNVPFVSTFEGPTWADQWANVRSQTGGIYLVPDWSSLGPNGIAGQLGKIDGACKFIFLEGFRWRRVERGVEF